MKLYHGSHVEVRNPKILTASRVGDFGTGFYTTSSMEQARRWAAIRAQQMQATSGVVTVFEAPDSLFENPEPGRSRRKIIPSRDMRRISRAAF